MKSFVSLLLPLVTFAVCASAATSSHRPNIVFILADDLGLDGVSCYGSDLRKTPNIDKLASTGLRFDRCYAAPLCGPARCLFNTGRYAFHSGGLTNQSWRPGGPGAKAADERPVARLLKAAGYVTGMSGKWRQVGETPHDWGYDEYLTDRTAGGWYWQTQYEQNGQHITAPAGTYGPDLAHQFAVDFFRRHQDRPFFFYYATHLVHTPIHHTPDSKPGAADGADRYDDDIAYMDKEVGAVIAELEKLGLRDNTLVVFSADNGTALNFPTPIHGRMINGRKGSMLEGGARVPLIANWPNVTPSGKVSSDLVSFADLLPTFVDVAGGSLPQDFKHDGVSFAPQLHGQPGTPRDYVYVQLGGHWYVRNEGYKLTESGDLFDLSDAPFAERPIARDADTPESKAARQHLSAVLADLNPSAGKVDRRGGGHKKGKKRKR